MNLSSSAKAAAAPALLAATLFLVSLNLRPALSGMAPLLEAIRSATGLSAAGAGVLTTLPVLCFGLIAPVGAMLAQRFSIRRTVLAGLLLLALSLGLRVVGGLPALFAGTFAAGAAIGVVMVLLPGIIKRDFAQNVGLMTGLYTMALSLGAALGAGLAVPLAQLGADDNWRLSLALWAAPAVIAAAAWAACAPADGGAGGQNRGAGMRALFGDALAWQVAGFMGLQSLLAYCVFGWLPTMLIDRGMTPLAAGAALSVSIAAQLPATLAGPWIAGRGRDQRMAVLALMVVMMAGLAGCLYAPPGQVWWWVVLLGIGQGSSFTIATLLVVLRSPDTRTVAALSGMTQLVGYLLAACGPFITGLLYDWSGGWNAPAVFFALAALAALAAGLGAGRKRFVHARE
ncbi:MFS transporter [Noviherbaspirillum aridicola]|uniref:MFS transporter n=1 Tax=Noviherbaspirillum aridicola TaxID=2849687 RepID=A0ABQ4Q2M6_9BURK|nr:MFS transporter [Noviherbaspirillum aridicola]GIZ51436.1 MFS transporter [Noviherbaspirillum aridicola]